MKILLATDGSDCSLEAANSACPSAMAGRHGVQSNERPGTTDVGQPDGCILTLPGLPFKSDRNDDHGVPRPGHFRNQGRAEILFSTGKKVLNGDAMPVGEPRSEILDAAKTWGADLIVLGSHGRRGMDRFFLAACRKPSQFTPTAPSKLFGSNNYRAELHGVFQVIERGRDNGFVDSLSRSGCAAENAPRHPRVLAGRADRFAFVTVRCIYRDYFSDGVN